MWIHTVDAAVCYMYVLCLKHIYIYNCMFSSVCMWFSLFPQEFHISTYMYIHVYMHRITAYGTSK